MDTAKLTKEEGDIHFDEVKTTEPKRWTDSETRQLIALFRESENLWNTQSKDYRSRLKNNGTIRHIAEKLKVEPSEVSRKLHNLRTQFNSELRKFKEKSFEQGTDYISKWPHFSSLLFLGPEEIVGHLVQEQEVINNEEVETVERKKWSELETRQLIALFKENESLWNPQSKDYRNRVKKRGVIRRIAEILKVEPGEVSRKLHNLRTQFCSELRKIKEKSFVEGTDEMYISRWPHFTSLLFLGPEELADSFLQNTITDNCELESTKEQEAVEHIEEVETSEKKKWTELETQHLITLFKGNENLWNVQSKEYRNRVNKRDTIIRIAEILKVEPDEVTRKLHNLRTQFCSELRKMKEKSFEPGTDDVYTSSWPHFSSLVFLAPTPIVDHLVQESDHNYKELQTDNYVIEVGGFEEKFDDSDVTHSSAGTSTNSMLPLPAPPQKRKCEASPDVPPYVLLHQPRDQDEAFGEFVASELRQIKNPANKRKFKKIIMEAIANIAEADAQENVYEGKC